MQSATPKNAPPTPAEESEALEKQAETEKKPEHRGKPKPDGGAVDNDA